MTAVERIVITALVAGIAPAALACGYCIEDKIAAVYDYDVVTRAISRKHPVVFFAIEGGLQPVEASRRALEAIMKSAPGVDPASVRVSVESASASAAYDPRRASFAEMERSLSRKLATRGWSVAILRVMDQPAELKPAGKR